MIGIKRKEIFREFQKSIMTLTQNEALMCGLKEYSVSVKKQHTEVKIYVHNYTAVLTFYISGRVVIKTVQSPKEHDETVLLDSVDRDYVLGRCTVADLASRYMFAVFNAALDLRQRWRAEYRMKYNARMAAVAAAVNRPISVSVTEDSDPILSDEVDCLADHDTI